MDTVTKHGFLAQKTMIKQAMYRSGSVIEGGIIYIIHALTNVNMEAGETVIGLNHFVKRLIRKRKKGVSTKHSSNHIVIFICSPFSKGGIFSDRLISLDLSITIRCLIAKAGTNTKLFCDVFDSKE